MRSNMLIKKSLLLSLAIAIGSSFAIPVSAASSLLDNDIVQLEDTDISGNQEQPKLSVTIKWAPRESEQALAVPVIRLVDNIPTRGYNDLALYQLAADADKKGNLPKVMERLDELTKYYHDSKHYVEAQFRRAEILFDLGEYEKAQKGYEVALINGTNKKYHSFVIYKHAWTLFKIGEYESSLHSFVLFLDQMMPKKETVQDYFVRDNKIVDDTLYAMTIVFSYLEGTRSIDKLFSDVGDRKYEYVIYNRLADHYIEKERFQDAANIYDVFITNIKNSPRTQQAHSALINVYEQGDFPSQVRPAKERYIEDYGVGSIYWNQAEEATKTNIKREIRSYIKDLSQHQHALAQVEKDPLKKKNSYQAATHWYKKYIQNFADERETAEINFLLADILMENGDYKKAAAEYDATAYNYPDHSKNAEAAYRAIIALEKQEKRLSGLEKERWKDQKVNSILRFSRQFSKDPRAIQTQVAAAQELHDIDKHKDARSEAMKVLRWEPTASEKHLVSAWNIIAASSFAMNDYPMAEEAYTELLSRTKPSSNQRKTIAEQLAASIYKQGEKLNQQGYKQAAANKLLKVQQLAPHTSISSTATFDAGSYLVELKQWDKAVSLFENFHSQYPNSPLTKQIPAKLAIAYEETGQMKKAAKAYLETSRLSTNNQVKRSALLYSGLSYAKAEEYSKAIQSLRNYVNTYSLPLDASQEARIKLAESSQKIGDSRGYHFWLEELINAHNTHGTSANQRSIYLAAQASFTIAEDKQTRFNNINLTQPLKKTLAKKQQALKLAINQYTDTIRYEVQDFTTASNHRIGEIYLQLAKDLLTSQRPKKLTSEELTMYDSLLEEQAFPFEEKAIELFENNIALLRYGANDNWVNASLKQLKTMLPARYNKQEQTIAYSNEIN